jgi:hypothetical protein
MTKFLLSIDPEAGELYILHRQFPACLIHVVQTTPLTFRIVDLYDNIEESELLKHPFLDDAKKYFKNYGSKIFGGN